MFTWALATVFVAAMPVSRRPLGRGSRNGFSRTDGGQPAANADQWPIVCRRIPIFAGKQKRSNLAALPVLIVAAMPRPDVLCPHYRGSLHEHFTWSNRQARSSLGINTYAKLRYTPVPRIVTLCNGTTTHIAHHCTSGACGSLSPGKSAITAGQPGPRRRHLRHHNKGHLG